MKRDIKILREDNFSLAASVYHPQAKSNGMVIVAPATGILRQFYNSFASYIAEQGFIVLTFDNEGIGGSLKGDIAKCPASLVSWGRKDMTAVFKYAKSTFPGQKYHLVGHSAGGQIVGLMENANELSSIFNFACSSGSLRNMNYPFKVQAHFFMNFFIPLSNMVLGYTNSPKMGMGEALPKKVAKDWAAWCNSTGYIKYYLDRTTEPHLYEELDIPSLWVHAIDDDIANLVNVKDMIRVFPKMPFKILSLSPKKYDYDTIGHMKFFSQSRKKLWPLALDWLTKHS